MKTFIQIIVLGLTSILIHAIIQTVVMKMVDWPSVEQIRPLSIILTMLLFLISTYFVVRRWNGKVKPKFKTTLATMFAIQFLTILSLTGIQVLNLIINPPLGFAPDTVAIATEFDFGDFLLKILIFAILLPILVLTPMRIFDRTHKNNVS